MKQRKLVQYLEWYGCPFYWEGALYSIYINVAKNLKCPVPRLSEIRRDLLRAQWKQLAIPLPTEK